MNLDGKFYRALETFSNFFILNFIWLVMCLPIITIFPATTAMFGVVRQWKTNEDSGVLSPFFLFFKRNFKQSMLIELIAIIPITLLIVDFIVVSNLSSPLNKILMPFFILLGLLIIATLFFIFSVIVYFNTNLKDTIKNSFLFAISNLAITFSTLLMIGIMAFLLWLLPISFILIPSICAYIIYSFAHQAFHKVESQVSTTSSEQASL